MIAGHKVSGCCDPDCELQDGRNVRGRRVVVSNDQSVDDVSYFVVNVVHDGSVAKVDGEGDVGTAVYRGDVADRRADQGDCWTSDGDAGSLRESKKGQF